MVFESGSQSNTAGATAVDLERLRASAPFREIAGRNVSKANVRFYQLDGMGVVVKDYAPRPLWVRHSIGRFFTARETAAYRAAGDLPGLSVFLGRLGPFTLALRSIEGVALSSLEASAVPPGLFDRLQAILEALHERGIALADLHHRDVLVGPGGSAHVVDLATAWIARPGAGPVRRAIFRRLAALDRLALARMRARYTAASESDAVRAAAGRSGALLYRSGRRLKRVWDLLRGRRSRAVSSGRGKPA